MAKFYVVFLNKSNPSIRFFALAIKKHKLARSTGNNIRIRSEKFPADANNSNEYFSVNKEIKQQ